MDKKTFALNHGYLIYLDELSKKQSAAWKKIDQLITSKQQKSYDEAVTLIKDLKDVAERGEHSSEFLSQLADVRGRHNTKSSFVRRLDNANLT